MNIWTDSEIKRAIKILSESESVMDACVKLRVTPASIRAGFERARDRGVTCGQPSDHIGTARRKEGRTILVMPDTHAPFHSEEAVAIFLAVARAITPDVLVCLGDLFDCYSVSRFTKSPSRKHKIFEELHDGLPVVEAIDALNIPEVHLLEGNHELRLKALVDDVAPELDGMVMTMREFIGVDDRGWHWTEYKESLQLGHMLYSHDFGRAGAQACRQGLVDVGTNICFGHTHQLGVSYMGTLKNSSHVALNAGWLGDINAIDYRHRDIAKRSYQLGFGLVDEDVDGCVWPQAIAIVNGAAMVRGKRITA